MKKYLLSLLGFMMVLIWSVQLVFVFVEKKDIWWTPFEMAVDIQAAKNKLEMFVSGTDVKKILSQKQLLLKQADGSLKPVEASDIKFRFNNWDEHRADSYKYAMLDIVLIMLGVMMVGWDVMRKHE